MGFVLNSDYTYIDYNTSVEYREKLFLLNNRFDLIFKYCEIENNSFFRDLYIDQTRPDQTRPDQTRQYVAITYIFIIIQNIINYNLCCSFILQYRFFV
ncbi:hypothetical protein [uncultured Brachyspira sp.]|uniref:hypothetical protein n=1 Tax=uncultured Brachyspira sp. TaxID=221953 RepID=UPI0026181FA7|nr:hypothetical protein [uncultured Brachyspira sp.]